jgi:hypothetical protein
MIEMLLQRRSDPGLVRLKIPYLEKSQSLIGHAYTFRYKVHSLGKKGKSKVGGEHKY